jgi:allophanate hydrolase subunit 2
VPIEILSVRGLATVQDAGRPGRMHEGVPPGGALVPELAARANRAALNEDGAALLEVFGGLTLAPRNGSCEVATEDGATRRLAEDEALEIAPSKSLRVRYVAVRGGLSVPEVLGGRGTLLVARLGGHEGRALRRRDRIPFGIESGARDRGSLTNADARTPLDFARAIRVLRGPDVERFAEEAFSLLVSHPFSILAASDRTGTRLGGPPLIRVDDDVGRSAPMVRGAVEVPSSGAPIVLGPDHPTTGGYPVLAIVASADLGLFFARHVGASVRFALLD